MTGPRDSGSFIFPRSSRWCREDAEELQGCRGLQDLAARILMSASYESNSNDLFREKGGVKTLLSKIREKFYHDA